MVAVKSTTLAAPWSRTRSVLLIEDDAELAEFLAATLEAAKFHVERARDGERALAHLRGSIPDLIVTDLAMPGMGGHEFLTRMRADPGLGRIPVIVLSGDRDTQGIVRCFALGADDYIIKPVDPTELVVRIDAKLDRPPVPVEHIRLDGRSGLLSARAFRHELQIEMRRAARIGYTLIVAEIGFAESDDPLRATGEPNAREVTAALAAEARLIDLLGRSDTGSYLLAMPEASESEATQRLRQLSRRLTSDVLTITGFPISFVPAIGFVRQAPDDDADLLLDRLDAAWRHAEARPGVAPVRYRPAMRTRPPGRLWPNPLAAFGRIGFRRDATPGEDRSWGQRRAAWHPAIANARTARILLVEDEPELAERLSAELEHAGYHVDLAANGREALEYLRGAKPELIVTDVMMPGMGGLELMAALRTDPALAGIPAIMLTTRRRVVDIIRGFDLGADGYVTKPVDPAELLARVGAKIKRPPVPAELIMHDLQSGLLSHRAFEQELQREIHRAFRVGYRLTAAVINFGERAMVREMIGPGADAPIARQISATLGAECRPFDVLGRSADGGYLVMMPETSENEAKTRLERIAARLVSEPYLARGEKLYLTPVIGYAGATAEVDAAGLLARLGTAQVHAEAHLDLQPVRYEPAMVAPPRPSLLPRSIREFKEKARFPTQIALTFVLGWILPFWAYNATAALGYDLSMSAYYVIVVTLVVTCLLIWAEGFAALRRVDPPDPPDIVYPPASAIIAAYLPNEAATIVSTLEAMLGVDYPGRLQIILAYNTPHTMPIEKTLDEMAARDPRLEIRRIIGSTSKAQNVNAAMAYVRGEFTAIYDADHQPDPNSFRRAWRWINSGIDVVQGHCLIRNGDASWVARMVAVEFEQIYAVSHPGRNRLHGFGIFGGSNGFWRTDLLRRVRMRGSMLTEDIDSALRVVEAGGRIVNDPGLISRELAPTTFKGLTDQRLRWAQGWYQVTKIRLNTALRSKSLTVRQKIGMFYLLAWRELFPWIAMQIVPLIGFWAYQAGSFGAIDWFVPIFFLITLFVMTTGPCQIYFIARLAHADIRSRRRWLTFYVIVATLMYAEYKNLLCRVANIKEWLKEKAWKVTARE